MVVTGRMGQGCKEEGRSSKEIRENKGMMLSFLFLEMEEGSKRPTAVALKVACLVEGDNQRVDFQRWRRGK